MRRRIFLHGALKAIHPEPIEVEAATVAEAIKLITPQLPGFRPDPIKGRHHVQVSGFHTVESLVGPSDAEEIHIRPAFCGGKSGGFVELALGAVLVAAAFIPGLNAVSVLGATLNISASLFGIGISMLLGGVLQLIQTPKRYDNSNIKGHYLGTPQNTVDIGTRIPILYGRRKIGGQFLSFNIAAVDVGV